MPVTALTLGVDPEWATWLPHFITPAPVITFIQGCVLLIGGSGSLVLTAIMARRDDLRAIAPQALGIVVLDLILAVGIMGGAPPTS